MRTSFGCFLFMIVLISIALVFGQYGKLNTGVTYGLIGLSACCCWMYAPKDTRKNPIKNEMVRLKKKYLSVLVCIIYGVVVINIVSEKIKALVLISMILEIITILPIIDFINEKRLRIRRVEK